MVLPNGLDALFADGGRNRSLEVPVPPGTLVTPSGWDRPAYWASDGPVDREMWVAMRQAHAHSGLWPLLEAGGSLPSPWEPSDGEYDDLKRSSDVWRIDAFDANTIFSAEWDLAGGEVPLQEWREGVPFGQWPGLAAAGAAEETADERADEVVRNFDYESSLMLVPAARSADTFTALAWTGPGNCRDDMAPLSALFRSWEERFGARVVAMGSGDLVVSVAAPPRTHEHALHLTAEHYVFCSDNVGDFHEYADHLLNNPVWTFWWD